MDLKDVNIKCINKNSKYFPANLNKLSDCPENIFVMGDENILSKFSLAVVGSRKCSDFGSEIAKKISSDLSSKDIIIVSGFARGIDSVAHIACTLNNKKTIAVLGGGHHNIYPKENEKYIKPIIENGGAIISEYPPEYAPLKRNFLKRNRIIAALSDGVILIEAKNKSGSLSTINYAKKLKKNIFVVPGSIGDKLYEGSNKVLSEGAYCIRNAQDILIKYDKFKNSKFISNKLENSNLNMDKNLEEVYKVLSVKPKSIDEISLETSEPINQILYKLTILEIQGAVRKVDGQNFIKITQ